MGNPLANGTYFIYNLSSATTSDVLGVDPLKTLTTGTVNIAKLDSQLFKLELRPAQNGYLITHPPTGFALEVAGANPAANTPVVLSAPSGSTSQLWDIQPNIGSSSSNIYTVKNLASATYLEVTGATPQVTASSFVALPSQLWQFQLTAGSTATPTPWSGPVSGLIPNPGRPGDVVTTTLFPTSNICGDPQCGRTHICAADYNRIVRPMGYSGVS